MTNPNIKGASDFTLPFPPSVNAIWRSVKGRNIKSKPYRDWETEAGLSLLTQRPERHEGAVSVALTFSMPDERRRDLDNLIKPVLDLLVHHQVIQRDDWKFVREINATVGEGFDGVQVKVRAA